MTTTTVTDPVTYTHTTDVRLPRRATWALWGAAAGVLGVATNMLLAQSIDEKTRSGTDAHAIVDALSRGKYHAAAITGFLAVAALLFFAAGLARWARRQSSDALTLRVAPMAIVASAGALIAAYGVKGMLAAYLPGGFNQADYGDAARHVYFLMDDLAGYYGWWGVTIAAACLSHLALRERLLPRWIGVLGGLVVAIPLLFLAAFGFTGISGMVCPVFLLVAGIGIARQRD